MNNNECYYIFGATGKTGQEITRELYKRGCKVVACVRNKDKANEIYKDINDSVDIVEINEENIKVYLTTAFSQNKKNVIISTLAYNATDNEIDMSKMYKDQYYNNAVLIKIAKELSAEKFIFLSTLFIDRPYSWRARNIEYIRPKALFYKNLVEVMLRSSGLKYVIIRPGKLEDKGSAPTETNIEQGDKIFFMITRKTLGYIVADAITNTKDNTTFEAAGFPYMLNKPLDKEKLKSKLEQFTSDENNNYLIRNYQGSSRSFYAHNTALKLFTFGITLKLFSYILKIKLFKRSI